MKKIEIVAGSYHHASVKKMVAEVQEICAEREIEVRQVNWVPGSLEKPLCVDRCLKKNDVEGVVVLGIIERGETSHGLVIGNAVVGALVDLQIKYDKPVGVGIVGPDVFPSQIEPRLIPYARGAANAVANDPRLNDANQ